MKSEIKSATIINYVYIFVTFLITFFYTPFMLSKLGSEYGIYTLAASVISYFSLLDLGLGNTIVRFTSRHKALNETEKEKKSNAIFLILYSVIGLIAVIIGVIVYFNLGVFDKGLTALELVKFKKIFLILLLNIIVSFPLSIFGSYISASEKFIYQKTIQLIFSILKPVLITPLLFLGYKSVEMVIIITILNISFNVINFIYAKTKLKMKFDFKLKKQDFKIVKEIFSFSFFILLAMIVDSVFNNTDQVILGIVVNSSAVAIYGVAVQIRNMNQTFSTAFSGLFLPRISKMVAKGESIKEISKIFNKVSRIQMLIMLLILSGFIIFGKPFVLLWVGKGYIDVYYIVLVTIVFAFIPLTQNVGLAVIQAYNKHQFRAIVFLIIAVINILISIPLAKLYSGIGAAIGTAIANILGQILAMNWYYSKKVNLNIKQYWKDYLKIVLPILILTIPIKLFIIDSLTFTWIKLLLFILLYTLIYALYMWNVIMNDYEKGLVFELKDKLLKRLKR